MVSRMESLTTFLKVPNRKTKFWEIPESQHAVQAHVGCKSMESPCYILTVRIIRMRNLHPEDWFSESDCYVTLWLPTSSLEKYRTKTVTNCKDPIWNEIFYFRIQSQVKNVLELTICDEDFYRNDDNRVIYFDVAKIPLGESIMVKFELDHLKNEEMEVEFTLENIEGPHETIATNGAVVCREFCCLEFQVDRKKRKKKKKHSKQQDVKCTLKGSFEETQNISLTSAKKLQCTEPSFFHYAKYNPAELDILLPGKRSFLSFCSCMSCGIDSAKTRKLTLPVHSFPLNQEIIKEDKEFNLYFTAQNCTSDLDVRLGFDLCPEEEAFLKRRKKVTAAAFKKILQLEDDLQEDEVPVVAIMTTGGGIRAVTAMYAHLLTLQKLGALDCVSYLTGLSGTTWTMSRLYQDPNWSQNDLEKPLRSVQNHVTKNKFLASFAPEKLKYYAKELWQRYQEGYSVSFTDLWGLIIEAMLHSEENPHKLSDQQQALTDGQNPLPIYLCLNVKEKLSNRGFREWLEFTPYEVGFQKYGAYIRAEHFGSEFFMGRLMKKIPESRICFLEGIWSSVFSVNIMDGWFLATNSEDFWQIWTRDRITEIEELMCCPKAYKLPVRVQCPPGSLASVLQDVIMWRPAVSLVPNFLRGCPMHDKYLESGFANWKDCDLDSFPNQLTGAEEHLYLVDNAFALDTSYPPLMRPERKVDVFIHLNYSSGSQLRPLQMASNYFSEQGIPFPRIIPQEQDDKDVKECYLLDQEGPNIPLVLLYPLVCNTFQTYKEPGVKRSPEEMNDGDIDVTSTCGPYNINALQYSEEDFEKLVKLSQYNIQNNKSTLIDALRLAVERKKQYKKSLHILSSKTFGGEGTSVFPAPQKKAFHSRRKVR
ncbi:cytosolic phospholipase A2 epsilon-like [Pituophis catenifer annectens]|uniref:cytosolic phospholipase A2 epsilon-like n=1 Tax=Pituophis catenifer annectens TaxID=94852 RepID=UPI0039965240